MCSPGLNRRNRFGKLANVRVAASHQDTNTEAAHANFKNNLTTPTVHTSMRSDIFSNNRHMR